MIDLTTTIIAKSDQLNADDLIGGPITITVTRVSGTKEPEQPISIYFEGDNGKPYKPGKSMRRVLVQLWGKDGEGYVGKSMTLYRDPEVTFGKLKVGGIRISHMTDIDDERELALAVTKGAKRAFKVRPLVRQSRGQQSAKRTPEEMVDAYVAGINACEDRDALIDYQQLPARADWVLKLRDSRPDLYDRIIEANSRKAQALMPVPDEDDDDDGFPAGPGDDEREENDV